MICLIQTIIKALEKLSLSISPQVIYSPGGSGIRGGLLFGACHWLCDYGGLMHEMAYAPFGQGVSSIKSSCSLQLMIVSGFARWNILQNSMVTPYLDIGGGGVFFSTKAIWAKKSRFRIPI